MPSPCLPLLLLTPPLQSSAQAQLQENHNVTDVVVGVFTAELSMQPGAEAQTAMGDTQQILLDTTIRISSTRSAAEALLDAQVGEVNVSVTPEQAGLLDSIAKAAKLIKPKPAAGSVAQPTAQKPQAKRTVKLNLARVEVRCKGSGDCAGGPCLVVGGTTLQQSPESTDLKVDGIAVVQDDCVCVAFGRWFECEAAPLPPMDKELARDSQCVALEVSTLDDLSKQGTVRVPRVQIRAHASVGAGMFPWIGAFQEAAASHNFSKPDLPSALPRTYSAISAAPAREADWVLTGDFCSEEVLSISSARRLFVQPPQDEPEQISTVMISGGGLRAVIDEEKDGKKDLRPPLIFVGPRTHLILHNVDVDLFSPDRIELQEGAVVTGSINLDEASYRDFQAARLTMARHVATKVLHPNLSQTNSTRLSFESFVLRTESPKFSFLDI